MLAVMVLAAMTGKPGVSQEPAKTSDGVAAAASAVDTAANASAKNEVPPNAPGADESSSAAQAQSPAPQAKPKPDLFTRWGKAYLADWTGTTAADPNAPTRRGTPPPISSPPFPAADWPIGGTQEIGAPDYGV